MKNEYIEISTDYTFEVSPLALDCVKFYTEEHVTKPPQEGAMKIYAGYIMIYPEDKKSKAKPIVVPLDPIADDSAQSARDRLVLMADQRGYPVTDESITLVITQL